MKCHHERCRRKLKPSDEIQKCRCGGVFCNTHRFYTHHECPFNYTALKPASPGAKRMKSTEWPGDAGNLSF